MDDTNVSAPRPSMPATSKKTRWKPSGGFESIAVTVVPESCAPGTSTSVDAVLDGALSRPGGSSISKRTCTDAGSSGVAAAPTVACTARTTLALVTTVALAGVTVAAVNFGRFGLRTKYSESLP